MTKDELIKFLYLQIGELQLSIEEYGDYDELVENVASNGNHNDTFELADTYGWLHGRKVAYETVLSILIETPDVEYKTN